MVTRVDYRSAVADEAPTYRLLLVEVGTGVPVVWPPFLQALQSLCAELRHVELAYETGESAALFWLPPVISLP